MSKFIYGTREHAENEHQKATLNQSLLREAIAARLIKGEITPDNLTEYAEILEDAEKSLTYTKNALEKEEKENVGDE